MPEPTKVPDSFQAILDDMKAVANHPFRSDVDRAEVMDEALWSAMERAVKLLIEKIG